MATKTETFYLEVENDALKFVKSCADEGITATLLPVEEQDGRKYYPVKVTYDTSKLRRK
jgi:hypothetical protein